MRFTTSSVWNRLSSAPPASILLGYGPFRQHLFCRQIQIFACMKQEGIVASCTPVPRKGRAVHHLLCRPASARDSAAQPRTGITTPQRRERGRRPPRSDTPGLRHAPKRWRGFSSPSAECRPPSRCRGSPTRGRDWPPGPS
jgi:hypothetical protein